MSKNEFKKTEMGMIPKDWEIKPLFEVTNILTGFPFKGDKYSTEGIRVLRGENVSIGFIRWDTKKHWKENFDQAKKYSLKEGDVVIGMDGSRVGKNKAIIKKKELPLLLAQRVARLRSKSNLNQDFLGQVILSKRFYYYVESIKTGTSIPHISSKQISKFIIPLPSTSEQKSIAKILSDLDSKIELLQEQNKTLEEIGQTIFKHWFIDFEFPNEEGKPYKNSGGEMKESEMGEIPKDWDTEKYSKIVSILTGKGLKRKEYVENGQYPVLGANGELGKTDNYLFDENLILTGRVGTLGTIYLINDKVWVSDNVLISRPTVRENYYFAYFTIKKFDFQSLNRGSTQPLITQTDLKNQNIILPEKIIIKQFNQDISNLFNKVDTNKSQIQSLQKTRDLLLPKLMSGKIRVKING